MELVDNQDYEIMDLYKMQQMTNSFEDKKTGTAKPNIYDKCEIPDVERIGKRTIPIANNRRKCTVPLIVFFFITLCLTLLSLTLSAFVYIENVKTRKQVDLLVKDLLLVKLSAKDQIGLLAKDLEAVNISANERSVQLQLATGLVEGVTANISILESEVYSNNLENAELFQELAHNFTVSQINLNILAADVTQDLRTVLLFESCAAISNLSLPFSCGVYNIRNSDYSYAHAYCQLDCTDTFEGWRRVAYLNVSDTTASSCPGNLIRRSQPSSCASANTVPGCFSVVFSTSSITYSKIIGRVQGYLHSSPDGFQKFGDSRPTHPTLDENYVDGISLTYGSPRKHIWTFTAITNFPFKNCTLCSINKPDYVGSHYSCDVPVVAFGSVDSTGWSGDDSQCAGDRYFYRQLPLPTSEDIEMRLCTDEVAMNEDISIANLEIFVQ